MEDGLGVRLKRFVVMMALLVVIAGMVLIGVTASKMSEDALALGSGVVLGCVGALIPVLLILFSLRFVVRYLEEKEVRRSMRNQQGYGQQPMVIMMPQYPQQQPMWDPRLDAQIMAAGPRQFTVIGEE